MKASGDGILDRSVFYFHTASGFAQELLFYLDSVGHFFCDARYCVRRASHESFLLLYVHTGKCAAQYEGRSYTMQPGEALFIDCHRPHEYRAVELSEIYWVHFNGNVSRGGGVSAEYRAVFVEDSSHPVRVSKPHSGGRAQCLLPDPLPFGGPADRLL